jgi:hypothetical protein
MTLWTTAAARQQIPNKHQWTNSEAVFSAWSVRRLRDAKTEELMGEVFSVRSVPKCYKQDKSSV